MKKINIYITAIAIQVFLSQIYLFSNGYPQIHNVIFIVIAALILSDMQDSRRFYVFVNENIDILKYLILFNAWLIITGCAWGIVEESLLYMMMPVYLVFDIMVFMVFAFKINRVMEKEYKKKKLTVIFFVILFVSLCINVLGFGKYWGGTRYAGLHNDPNQFALYVICLCLIITVLSKNITLKFITILVGGYLIIDSGSRTGAISIVIYTGFLIMDSIKKEKTKIIHGVPIFLLLILVFYLFLLNSNLNQYFRNANILAELKSRGYFLIYDYPQYLLFGAGWAEDFRFNQTNEIHSIFVAILFYSGIFGFILFALFIYKVTKSSGRSGVAAIATLMIFGLFTFNIRTPIFWIALSIIWIAGSRKMPVEVKHYV